MAQVGPYRMLAELGRGGMGRVLLGSAPDGRLVAVKAVHDSLAEDEGFRERFHREVAASRRVSGAYTAPVVDADADAPTPWLASAFVAGPSLQRAVDEGGPLQEEAVLRLAAGLVTALGEVHGTGLVHRDLKPANVLLAEDGPRVIDFGIARAFDVATGGNRLTKTGWLIGSPSYMSPEQAEGRELGPSGDVFSLGAVLVMACTGASPFAAASVPQELYRVVHAEPDLSTLPSRVRLIAAACLAKDPGARPDLAGLREMIGELTPSVRPWPATVYALAADQRAEIDRLLSRAQRAGAGAADQVAVQTADMPTAAATRALTGLPLALEDPGNPRDSEEQLAAAAPPAPGTPGRARRPAAFGALACLVLLAGIVLWTQWPSSRACAAAMAGHCAGHAAGPTGSADDTASSNSTASTSPAPGPSSYDSSGTDRTPFTEDALLPRQFTDDKGITFARVGGGARRCDQAASGDGPFKGSDVVKELTARGCTRVMTGVYLEQSGPNSTADNPVLVSIQVFPLPDAAAAEDMSNYLNGGVRWNLTTWCTQSGVGTKPCIPGISHGTRLGSNQTSHRYMIAAVAVRTDLSSDSSINPWLSSAAAEAANSAGPQNNGGQ
ncbi:serine/threonine-protein kinase [Streptomyces sp. NPDC056656]|uniref:serine/threonine-protein kinase n=1 Tax=Streptomyces sp. NPDC056656 TaxID=3345895 RepID=UPI0036C3B2D1